METEAPKTAPEHQTHTAALVFLTIAAVVVSFVAFSSTRLNQAPEATPDGENTATIQTSQSSGTLAARLPADATLRSDLEDFPAGLPLGGESTLVENYHMPIETGETERVLTYDTTSSPLQVRAQYTSWLAENDYQIVKEKSASVAASMAAINADDRDLIVLISRADADGEGARVQLVTHYSR